jgi:hypothetical protein
MWKDGLDSPCMLCHGSFNLHDGDPPIRTFTFETSEDLSADVVDIGQAPIAPHPIRVFNRHLRCIQAKRFICMPISHVWHQPVSKAQIDRSSDLNAVRLAYQIPIQTLFAVTKKLGSVEIWHDYLSVPQWQVGVQQQLLLQIPTIFLFPPQMVMHLDDVQASDLYNIQAPSSYTCFIDAISKLTKSRWFDRMWVTLEYIQSKEVIILTQYFDIFETPAMELSNLAGANIGKFVKRLGQDRFNQLSRTKGFQWEKRASWGDMETWKTLNLKYRNLGAAILIIAQKKCRDPRDCFFAFRGLLNLRHNKTEIKTILSDDIFESFLDVVWDALQGGDYSPLLFRPPESERKDSRAPWLRGYHYYMSQNLWDLSICRQPANHQVIIRGDLIQPSLESIGVVESFHYYDFVGCPETVFQVVSSKILRIQGPSSRRFCAAVDRILPCASDKELYLTPGENPIERAAKYTAYDYNQLGVELERYEKLLEGEHGRELLSMSKKLVAFLGLGLPQKLSYVSRIKSASDDAEFYGKRKESLVSVRCTICSQMSAFRVTAWAVGSPPDQVVPRTYSPHLIFTTTLLVALWPDGFQKPHCHGGCGPAQWKTKVADSRYCSFQVFCMTIQFPRELALRLLRARSLAG